MTPFLGGFGLLNFHGIPMPSHFAYAFLNHLASGAPESTTRVTVNAAGQFDRSVSLRTNDCVLLTLTPAR